MPAWMETSSEAMGSSSNRILGSVARGAGNGDALALASGELRGEAVDVIGVDAHEVHQIADAVVDLGLGPLLGLERLGEHVVDGHARVERAHGVLEDDLQVATHLVALATVLEGGDVTAEDGDLAALGLSELHDLHERGGLAGTGLAHECERLALMDLEAHVVDGGDDAFLAADEPLTLHGEGLDEVLDLKHHRTCLTGHVGPLGGQRIELGEHILIGEALIDNLLEAMACGQMAHALIDDGELSLGLEAHVGRQRTAR